MDWSDKSLIWTYPKEIQSKTSPLQLTTNTHVRTFLQPPTPTMASTEVKVPFFKKKGRPTTNRRRDSPPPASAATVDAPSSSKSEVVIPTRKQATNLLSAGTKRTASQRQDEDEGDEPTRNGHDVKWTSAGSHINAALEILEGDEAEAMLAKKQRRSDSDDEDVPDDGQYRGQKGYQTHLKKNKEVPKAMRVGPQRASGSTIRTVTIVDYQPDVCKDYKGEPLAVRVVQRMNC